MSDESRLKVPAANGASTVRLAAQVARENESRSVGAADNPPLRIFYPEPPKSDLDRYRFASEHARGGLGRIMSARDLRLDRAVAVKQLLTDNDEAEARFIREALITARLQHPAIVPIYDLGHSLDERPFYAMKMVEGRSLADVMRERRALNERLALIPNVIAVADAIAYAHGQRIIHRDLKPSNILIGPFGETVVVDWGLAADLNQAAKQSLTVSGVYELAATGVTVAGTVMGTPEYMPPEQAEGKSVDERADVYALGAILYRLLAGSPPYEGDTSKEVLAKLIKGAPTPLERRQPGVPKELATIVNKAMGRSALERYPTAKELAEDLKRFQTGQLVSAHNYTSYMLFRRWLRKYRGPVLLTACFLLALGAIAIGGVQRIVRERNRAEENGTKAELRNQRLILLQAEAFLKRDPTASVAWLKTFPMDGGELSRVHDIAAKADSLGIARHLFRAEGNGASIAISPDGRLLAYADDHNNLMVRQVIDGHVLASLKHQGSLRCITFGPKGDMVLFSAAEGRTIHLWRLTDGQIFDFEGHLGSITSIAFSPDGNTFASAAMDDTVRIWEVATRKLYRIFTGHQGDLTAKVVFSGDGLHIAANGKDQTIAVWSVDGRSRRILRGHHGNIQSLAYAPHSNVLASADSVGSLRIWDFQSGRVRSLSGHTAFIEDIAFAADGRLLASGGQDKSVRLWSVATGTLQAEQRYTSRIVSLAFGADAQTVAIGLQDGTIHLWNHELNEDEIRLGHSSAVTHLVAPSNRAFIVSASSDRTVRVWAARTKPFGLIWHSDPVAHLAFSGDGTMLASGSRDGAVQIWNLKSNQKLHLLAHRGLAYRVLFTPGQRLVTGSFDGTVRLWDILNKSSRVLHHSRGVIWDLARSPGGEWFASADSDGKIHLWSSNTLEDRLLHGHNGDVRSLAFSPDSDSLVSAGSDKTVRVWNVKTGQVKVWYGHQDIVYRVLFSPDASFVVSASFDKSVRLWEMFSGNVRTFVGHKGQIRSIAISPDGQLLASGGEDRVIQLRNLKTGDVRSLIGHTDQIRQLAFSPDGKLLASGSYDGTVTVWDAATGFVVYVYRHGESVSYVEFSADGQYLASAGWDRMLQAWKMSSMEFLPTNIEDLRKWMEVTTTAHLKEDDEIASN